MIRLLVPLTLLIATPALADPLPRVTEADWQAVRGRCLPVLATLKKAKALPADVEKHATDLLSREPKDADEALERLQELLDPFCLVGININPESRVKAARGPLAAELVADQPRLVLVKVNNEGGITAPLAVAGDELVLPGRKEPGRWLTATLPATPLGGQKLEYVVLTLTSHEAGKREATLKFDAGQGTQDLGFRAARRPETLMPDPTPARRLFQNARREALVVVGAWVVAFAWTVGWCWLFGYPHGGDTPDPKLVLGFPDWVFWGIVIPWVACTLFTIGFGLYGMSDDDLGADAGQEKPHGH